MPRLGLCVCVGYADFWVEMRIFALDACTADGSAALINDNIVAASAFVSGARTHGETLLPMVKSVLDSAFCTIDDIDMFACTVGPGSFTGIRVAVSMIKGLAFGRQKPCVAVSSLEALAYGALELCAVTVPVCDARRGNFYNAVFTSDGGSLMRECEDRLTDGEMLAREVLERARTSARELCFVGDGALRMRELCASLAEEYPSVSIRCAPELVTHPHAASAARVAYLHYADMSSEEKALCTDERLAALYLRPTLAERELEGGKNENK